MKAIGHRIRRAVASGVALLFLAACDRTGQSKPKADDACTADIAATITRASQASTDAWNRGDLPRFLAPYAGDVTVVQRSGPEQGVARLEASLRRAQPWNGPPPMLARFIEHRVSCPAPGLAVQVALVEMSSGGRPNRLWMTSLWERRPDGWRVIHEQSF